ncbi:putative translation initiation inhibitor, yjgF family [Rhizobium leguminosarum bv. trifolii WSM2297]|uniref:Putative translation initiation inhibitor, yjgF family n=1 Tax=Rhizobium leguminosarum bv. trifolii WSM2297 TaxID=754762 RepID=J0CJC1_RHILT|nr:RidA family protein [Rhizobium leguminosarum]EJC83747.1 putative translation initiation inhibitor, yjgF family [Rhizobium leguminosarum bv. trifolii WSM2297]EJC84662.1 putative translation initiation inhibitor, yjgF family [Rhizobium leguminosarum bv. trifolii WSM2297]
MSNFITVNTSRAPSPAGHYVQAKLAGQHLYISGQLPIRPAGEPLADDSFESQAGQAIDNMLAVLKAAGGTPADLVRVTAYIVGVSNWPRFNQVYAGRLGDARPARTVVPVPELHYGYLVEVDAIAVLEKNPSAQRAENNSD